MNRVAYLTILILGLSHVAPLHAQDEAASTPEATKELTIGSAAPTIDIEHWLSDGNGKFDPINEFEEGSVYVVEFWATWCGPCIGSMPHLVELQQKHVDQGVTIVSVSDEPLDTVTEFLEREVRGAATRPANDATDAESANEDEQTEPSKPTYGDLTSAYCLTTDPDQSVKNDYFRAAGQSGIPCAFIVGKSGVVEWIGHPMAMDDPLQQVIDDVWDREMFAEEFRSKQLVDKIYRDAVLAARAGNFEQCEKLAADLRALELSPELAKRATAMANQLGITALSAMFAKAPQKAIELLPERVKSMSPAQVNMLGMQMVRASARDEQVEPDLLQTMADLLEQTINEDQPAAIPLYTLAKLYHQKGDLEKALEFGQRAVDIGAQGRIQTTMDNFLQQLQEEQTADDSGAEETSAAEDSDE